MEKLCGLVKKYWLVSIILFLSIGINYYSSKFWDVEVRIDVGVLSIITAVADLATLFALVAVMFQITTEKKKTREEKVDNTFFNLVQMFNSTLDELNQIKIEKLYSDSDGITISRIESGRNQSEISDNNVFSCILKDIKKQQNERIKENYKNRQINFMRENLSDLEIAMSVLENPEKATKNKLILLYEENIKGKRKNEIDKKHFVKFLDIIIYNNEMNTYMIKKIDTKLKGYIENLEGIKDEKLSEDEKVRIANKVFDYYYENLGKFTRLIHQITKFINDNVKSLEQKDIYFSTLRSTLSENELLTVFYFAFHSKRGSGLKQQLTNKTNLFGHDEELPLDESEELQHFKKSSLIYNEEDIKEMRKCQ